MYKRWEDISILISEGKVSHWKQHPSVKYMLEHESESAAVQYISDVLSTLTYPQIQGLAYLNDLHGSPEIKQISGIITSTSSIRYVKHSHDALQHAKSKNLDDITIVEIGGGYGGLALVMFGMAKILNIKIKKYVIYDLPHVCKLQQYYLGLHNIKNVVWNDCNTFASDLNKDDNNVVVSCYCLSEIENSYRTRYLENLLPVAKACYFVWNWGSKEALPTNRDERPEIPDTSGGRGNTIIRL